MPKNIKKSKARRRPHGAGGAPQDQKALGHASVRSRAIMKTKGPLQQAFAGTTAEQQQDLFQMLFLDNDTRKLERALITLASISLDPSMAQVDMFYEAKVIERLLQ